MSEAEGGWRCPPEEAIRCVLPRELPPVPRITLDQRSPPAHYSPTATPGRHRLYALESTALAQGKCFPRQSGALIVDPDLATQKRPFQCGAILSYWEVTPRRLENVRRRRQPESNR